MLSYSTWRAKAHRKKHVSDLVRGHVVFRVIMRKLGAGFRLWRHEASYRINYATKMWGVGTKLVYQKQANAFWKWKLGLPPNPPNPPISDL